MDNRRISSAEWEKLKATSSSSPTTESERNVAEYLDARDWEWCYEPEFPGTRKRPDFVIWRRSIPFVIEVKERAPKDFPGGVASSIPWRGIRDELKRAASKLRCFKEYCCALAIANTGDWSTTLTPANVFAAMLGDLGVTVPIEHGRMRWDALQTVFLERGGRMVHPHTGEYECTTISAVIILDSVSWPEPAFTRALDREVTSRQNELGRSLTNEEQAAARLDVAGTWASHGAERPMYRRTPRMVVCDHPRPRIPLPRDMFTEPCDERYVLGEQGVERVYCGARVPLEQVENDLVKF